jgi:hypothetical protein
MEINMGLEPKYRQSIIQYLWCYVPCTKTGATRGYDEVDWPWPIVDPSHDRLTNELCVIGDDFGVEYLIPATLEQACGGGAGLVEGVISEGCIADGQYGCGHHEVWMDGCVGVLGCVEMGFCWSMVYGMVVAVGMSQFSKAERREIMNNTWIAVVSLQGLDVPGCLIGVAV